MKIFFITAAIFCFVPSNYCQEKCSSDLEFLCHSGGCISKVFLCDGSRECFDGSDETHDLCQFRGCSESIDFEKLGEHDIFSIPTLGRGQTFRCGYGACISKQFTCDGISHCVLDGSDETHELCKDVRCKRREFKCDYGGCTPRRNVCDNSQHCSDGSDETPAACKWRRRRCSSSRHFQCGYGACIPIFKKCDRTPDCLDGSDESEATCGYKLEVTTSVTTPTITFAPPTIKTVGSIIEFPDVGSPVTFVPPSQPKPVATSAPGSVGKGQCQQTDNKNVNREIFFCGDDSGCGGKQIPEETLILFYCPEGAVPLRCKGDALWHFERPNGELPREKPCQAQEKPVTRTKSRKKLFLEPKTCGVLPANQPIPWLVGLFREQEFSCTGTLIGPALVLTAGHCIVRNQAADKEKMDVDKLKIQFNSENPNDPNTFASVSAIELHPLYSGGTTPRFDVALLFLTENLEESAGTSSACLDTQGRLLRVSAWTFDRTYGQLSYGWSNVEKIMDPSCFNRATKCSRHLDIGDNQYCGENKEPSSARLHQGSSGGPYFIQVKVGGEERWTTAGVVSHSFDTSECGTNSVFTSVSKLHSWIVNCGFHDNCSA